jgi:hypothetical protein
MTFSWKSSRLWDSVEEYCGATDATDDNIIRRMRIAYWLTKATERRLEYVILIVFPWQQQFLEHTSVLRYTYIASHVSV